MSSQLSNASCLPYYPPGQKELAIPLGLAYIGWNMVLGSALLLVCVLAFVLYCRYAGHPERLRELALGLESLPLNELGEDSEPLRLRRTDARGETEYP